MDLFLSPYTKLLKVSNITRMESMDEKGKACISTLNVGKKKHYHYSLHTWLNMKIMENTISVACVEGFMPTVISSS